MSDRLRGMMTGNAMDDYESALAQLQEATPGELTVQALEALAVSQAGGQGSEQATRLATEAAALAVLALVKHIVPPDIPSA